MEVPIGFPACLSYPWNVADVSIRFLQRQRSRGPHESIIASFEKLLPPFPLRPVKRRFSARRAATRLEFARVIQSKLLYYLSVRLFFREMEEESNDLFVLLRRRSVIYIFWYVKRRDKNRWL